MLFDNFFRMLRRVWKTFPKRLTSEYVLAKRVDGKLEVADFAREDKNFCFSPKISADGECRVQKFFLAKKMKYFLKYDFSLNQWRSGKMYNQGNVSYR